jgi:hypothetical protein
MNPLTCACLAISLLCASCSSPPSRGTATSSRQDLELKAKYKEVYRFNLRGLIEATLTKSKDLAQKGYDTYFCTYDSTAEPKPCDRMDTVSGQYEDFYRSQMACNERCPHARITQSSWDYIRGKKRICKEPMTGSCEKTALTVDQMREELFGLLRLEQEMNPRPESSTPDAQRQSKATDR